MRNSLLNKRIRALPTSPFSSLSCSARSCDLVIRPARSLTDSFKLGSPSSLVKTLWRRPWNYHLLLWNIAYICRFPPSEGFFSQLLTVPLYRQPNTLGWPFFDSAIAPADPSGSASFLPLQSPEAPAQFFAYFGSGVFEALSNRWDAIL